jgi:hypothetical protein
MTPLALPRIEVYRYTALTTQLLDTLDELESLHSAPFGGTNLIEAVQGPRAAEMAASGHIIAAAARRFVVEARIGRTGWYSGARAYTIIGMGKLGHYRETRLLAGKP